METKTLVWIGLAVGGAIGSLAGAALDHGNMFGGWSILLAAIGSFVGIWAGYKIGNS